MPTPVSETSRTCWSDVVTRNVFVIRPTFVGWKPTANVAGSADASVVGKSLSIENGGSTDGESMIVGPPQFWIVNGIASFMYRWIDSGPKSRLAGASAAPVARNDALTVVRG